MSVLPWVTHELKPHDLGEPGGPVEMTRMLCFEFADSSGGSEWPVDADWQPPAVALTSTSGDSPGTLVPVAIAAALAVVLLVGASFVASRKGQS